MSGYKLKEGRYSSNKLEESEIWASFEKVFSSKSQHSSSYKFVFLAALFKCIKQDKLTFSFYEVFECFLNYYWSLIVKWHLRQETVKARITEIERIINNQITTKSIVSPHELSVYEYDSLINEVVKKCQTYVVGALYADTNQQMYSFSKKEQYISINPQYKSFIQKHRSTLEGMLYYDLAKYYVRINDAEYFEWVKTNSNFKYDDDLFYAREIIANVFEGKPDFTVLEQTQYKKPQDEKVIDRDVIEDDYDNLVKYIDDPEEIIKMLAVAKGVSK